MFYNHLLFKNLINGKLIFWSSERVALYFVFMSSFLGFKVKGNGNDLDSGKKKKETEQEKKLCVLYLLDWILSNWKNRKKQALFSKIL